MSERILSRQEVLKLLGKPSSTEPDESPNSNPPDMDSTSESSPDQPERLAEVYLRNLHKLLDPNL